jgi:predicted amidohydrolase
VVQAEAEPDLEAGLGRTSDLAAEAASGGASLIVFPETWLPGYPAWLDVCRDAGLWDHAPVKAAFARMAEESVVVPGPATERLGRIAREVGAVLVVGVTERVESGPGNGTLYNTLLVFGAGGRLLNHHRKLVPTYTERLVWGPGDAAGVRAVDTEAGRVGGLICWEHWMPLARQALHESGEDVHVAVWPTVKEMNLVASRQYAFEGRCYVLAAGSLMRAASLPPGLEPDPERVPSADALLLRGGSAILGPDGAVLAGPVFDEPAILTAEIEPARIREERMSLDVTGHYARPDCLRLVRTDSGRKAGG